MCDIPNCTNSLGNPRRSSHDRAKVSQVSMHCHWLAFTVKEKFVYFSILVAQKAKPFLSVVVRSNDVIGIIIPVSIAVEDSTSVAWAMLFTIVLRPLVYTVQFSHPNLNWKGKKNCHAPAEVLAINLRILLCQND